MTKIPTNVNPSLLPEHLITWEKLPDNFLLPDDPVENLTHPLLAAALTEILGLAGLVGIYQLVASNYGICATVNGKTVVKAPDWVYVANVLPKAVPEIIRSYTPNLEGDIPSVVMEFLSDTEGGEYSLNPRYPYGKWYFYERILRVPVYVIFEPELGTIEVRELRRGHYELGVPAPNGQYWIESLGLFLGVWQGSRLNRTGFWLRWWDKEGHLLPWSTEVQQQAQEAQRQAQEAQQKAELLAQKLRELGIDPENL